MERRTASSKTFTTERPGELRTEVHAGPVHYRDPQGRWADIDSDLGPSRDGRRKNKANRFTLELADSAADDTVARLGLDADHSVGFALEGAAKVKARAAKDSLTYAKVRTDTDVRLTSRLDGLKEELVLASPAAGDRFVFPLRLQNLTAAIDDAGDVVYRDRSGAERARTPHGFMTDVNVDPRSGEAPLSLGVTYALVPHRGGTALEVRLDREWLTDPARVWPVTVDPQLVAWARNDDTYVMSGFHRDNSWDPELKVGTYDGGAHVGRSFLHFDTGALAGATISSARLKVAERWSWNCAAGWPSVHRVGHGWDGRTMQDYPGAALDPTPVGPVVAVEGSCPNRTVHYDVASVARYWAANGPASGHGVGLVTNEGDNNAWKKFASTEAGLPAMLDVWYTPPNRQPAVPWGVRPGYLERPLTSTPTASAYYADPEGTPGWVAFWLYNQAHQVVWGEWSPQVCSGCQTSKVIAPQPDGWYYLRAIGHDGANYSPDWSPAHQWFFIDTKPPNPPTSLTPANGAVITAPSRASAVYSEPYGWAGHMYFWLLDSAGRILKEGWDDATMAGRTTANGGTATFALPALGIGSYSVYAMAYDGAFSPQVGPNTFTVDTTPPAITALSSPSHPNPLEWYTSRAPDFSWSASDSSGISGYSFVLDASPATLPDTVRESTAPSAGYTDIPRGQWWFHVTAQDRAGLWSEPAHVRVRIDDPFPELEFAEKSSGFEAWNDPWMVNVGSTGASTWQISDMSRQPESTVSFAAGGAAATLGNLIQSALDIVRAVAGDGTWEREYQALPGGAIIIDTLRSDAAPQVFPVTAALPTGWSLSQDGVDGDVLILDQTGATRGHVSAATALDAAGRAVPVRTTVSGGNIITTEVLHAGGGYAYPVVVDPYRYIGGNFAIPRTATTFYQWRQDEQTTKRINGATGEVVGEAKFTVTVTSRGNRQDPPLEDVHAHPQIRIEARPAFESPEREFSLYVEILCKENISGAKDPVCKDENGNFATAEYDSTESGQPFRSSYDVTRDVSLGDWPDRGEKRYYFYEVRVLINWRVGEPAIDRPDLGKYRTYDMTCTDTECYFDRRRPTGKGG